MRRGPYERPRSQPEGLGDYRLLESLLDPLGRGDVLLHPELLGLEAERQADELGEMEDGQAEIAVDDLGCLRLLHVQIEVAERAGRDQAIGVGVDRVADVGAGLPQ